MIGTSGVIPELKLPRLVGIGDLELFGASRIEVSWPYAIMLPRADSAGGDATLTPAHRSIVPCSHPRRSGKLQGPGRPETAWTADGPRHEGSQDPTLDLRVPVWAGSTLLGCARFPTTLEREPGRASGSTAIYRFVWSPSCWRPSPPGVHTSVSAQDTERVSVRRPVASPADSAVLRERGPPRPAHVREHPGPSPTAGLGRRRDGTVTRSWAGCAGATTARTKRTTGSPRRRREQIHVARDTLLIRLG